MTKDEGPLTIGDAAKRIRSGELTPSSMLEICLARIDRYELKVKAWVYIDRERARREAEQLTKELKEGLDRGPLHGVPIGVKDIIDVYDMPTGCGSKLWAKSYARRDATCVERLRQAGALILGKTVTTAYAYLDPPVTRNPWNLERTPGGSSSGSAAAVACGMCLGALGTQTGGSIIRPAAFCGVCALKPTYGRVSVDGVLPLAPSLDHVGVMANCVRDLSVMFQAIAGDDSRDESTSFRPVPECVRRIDTLIQQKSRGERSNWLARPGYKLPSDFYADRVSLQIAKFMTKIEGDLSALASSDAILNRIALPAGFNQIHQHHLNIMAVEAANTHAGRFARHPDDYPTQIRKLIQDGLACTAQQYRTARLFRDQLDDDFTHLPGLEPLVMPATTDVAPITDSTGSPWCNSPWSFLGTPVVTIPLGWSDEGLPMGIQIISDHWHEDTLLARAAIVEHVFRVDNAFYPRGLPPIPA
jgi:aspartyl-tRNA(Asn)/glutamyl-tRNA(Gln) amidotransferase subunit A